MMQSNNVLISNNRNSRQVPTFKTSAICFIIYLIFAPITAIAIDEITILETPVFKNGFQLPSVPQPIILNANENEHIIGDDRNAIMAWNSYGWTNHPDPDFDPEKQLGIYGYLVQWGTVENGFTDQALTIHRSYQIQPLIPGITYQARVYAISATGELSLPSNTITTSHDASRVESMRARLNGFFDDFNTEAGPFDELKWSQAYSGCVAEGTAGQHINSQFHGHNLLATGGCDRGVAISRPREIFDITDRTGLIEFDLDGAKGDRQFWYLDLVPVESPWGRKRDITGYVNLGSSGDQAAEPPGLLRVVQSGNNVTVQLSDDAGNLFTLDNVYRNGACGNDLRFCTNEDGAYNLSPQTNVRHQWQIELSQHNVKIMIEDILVLDASLKQLNWVDGLPWGKMQMAWTYFSYNTTKENIVRALLHWDNFGFDAPQNSPEPTHVIHNYTDGDIGAKDFTSNNCCAPRAQQYAPLNTTIPIPNPITDTLGNPATLAELMFTLQGSYVWDSNDHILVNDIRYNMPQPEAFAQGLNAAELIGSIVPYSALLSINPNDLISGNNAIDFVLNDIAVFNIHLELTYPIDTAPAFSQAIEIFTPEVYLPKIMPNPGLIGSGIILDEIDGVGAYQFDELADRSFRMNTPVSGLVGYSVRANSKAQMIAFGKITGMTHYQVWQDGMPILTVPVNENRPSPAFLHQNRVWDTTQLCNGEHTLFVKAYTPDGTPSIYDAFLAHSLMGEYRPVRIITNNPGNATCKE